MHIITMNINITVLAMERCN